MRFHQRIVDECLAPARFTESTRALDIGCGVGRLTFELGRAADHVVGIDNSRSFIQAARRLAKSRSLTVPVKESGGKFRRITIRLPKTLRNSAVEFRVGDALGLAAFAGQPFHIVAAINLLCRLPRPRQFLTQVHRLIVPGGQLVLGTPFSWQEEYTPHREWLDAKSIEAILRPHFRLVHRRELPFVIREHRRKYQLGLSEIATFVRR
jgi:SAM-dependent methyltransferase